MMTLSETLLWRENDWSSARDGIPDWGNFKISVKWPIKHVTCKELLKKGSWPGEELYPKLSSVDR